MQVRKDLTNTQFLMQFSSEKREAARVEYSLRMKIERWELNIGQILGFLIRAGDSARLFLREPLDPMHSKVEDI